MKIYIFILIFLVSVGCHAQIGSINSVIKNSDLVDLPIDYGKLLGIKGDSLQDNFEKELSASQYVINIMDKKMSNKPFSFQDVSLVGRVDLSSTHDIAIFRKDYNQDDAIYYLCSFSINGKLISALKIIDKGNIPNVKSTINKERVISITKEYEDHIEKYNFILQDDGVFKRTSYAEEKL